MKTRFCSCGVDLSKPHGPKKEDCGCVCHHIALERCKHHQAIWLRNLYRDPGDEDESTI
jgi:hypothetical protein